MIGHADLKFGVASSDDMDPWYERLVLVAGIVAGLPFLFFAVAYGPLALLGIPFEAIVAVAIWRRLRRARLHPQSIDATPRPDRRPPVLPVDDTTLADVPEPVTACPDCGFLGIRMLGIRDGVWPGGGEIGDKMTCPRCGYQGLALRFDTRADYGEFLRDLHAGA